MLSVVRGDGFVRGGILTFLKRRSQRILPTYYAALALSLLLIWLFIGTVTGTHWDKSLPVTFNGTMVHLLMLQDIESRSQIYHVLWSVALEWHIYFLFPLFVWARPLGLCLLIEKVGDGYFC